MIEWTPGPQHYITQTIGESFGFRLYDEESRSNAANWLMKLYPQIKSVGWWTDELEEDRVTLWFDNEDDLSMFLLCV